MVLQPLFVHGFFEKFAQKKIRSYFAPKKWQFCGGKKSLPILWPNYDISPTSIFCEIRRFPLQKATNLGETKLMFLVAYSFDVFSSSSFRGLFLPRTMNATLSNPGEGTMIITTTTFTPHQRRLNKAWVKNPWNSLPGQGRYVYPESVRVGPMVFSWSSLGILGDHNP